MIAGRSPPPLTRHGIGRPELGLTPAIGTRGGRLPQLTVTSRTNSHAARRSGVNVFPARQLFAMFWAPGPGRAWLRLPPGTRVGSTPARDARGFDSRPGRAWV